MRWKREREREKERESSSLRRSCCCWSCFQWRLWLACLLVCQWIHSGVDSLELTVVVRHTSMLCKCVYNAHCACICFPSWPLIFYCFCHDDDDDYYYYYYKRLCYFCNIMPCMCVRGAVVVLLHILYLPNHLFISLYSSSTFI